MTYKENNKIKMNLTYNLDSSCPSQYFQILRDYENGTYKFGVIEEEKALLDKIFVIPFEPSQYNSIRNIGGIKLALILLFIMSFLPLLCGFGFFINNPNDLGIRISMFILWGVLLSVTSLLWRKTVRWQKFMWESGFIVIGALGLLIRISERRERFKKIKKSEFIKWEDAIEAKKVDEIYNYDSYYERNRYPKSFLRISFKRFNHKKNRKQYDSRIIDYNLLSREEIATIEEFINIFNFYMKRKRIEK
jgi:hypothetical protein